jgi:hypothetical protein
VRGPVQVALAVNGVVRAVTETAPWGGSPHYFTAFLGDYPVQPGANLVEVLAQDPAAPGRRFVMVSSDLASGVVLRSGAEGEYLETNQGRRLRLDPEVTGMVDRIDEEPDGLVLHGWAVDRHASRQLRAIAVLSANSSVAFAFPADERPDVTAALGLAPSTKVSYAVRVMQEDLARGALRLFGIAADGRAGELQVGAAARRVLDGSF